MSTYTHEGRASIDGLLEGKPINDTSLLTEQQCNDAARAIVEANKLPVVNTRIQHPDLIDAIPEYSSVEIINAPNVIDGVYRVKRVAIDFSSGFSVKAEIEKPIPTFTEQVYESLASLVVPYIRPVTPSSGEIPLAV